MRLCFITFPNTSNVVKNTPLRVVFSTLFSMFGNRMKRCLSCLIYHFIDLLLTGFTLSLYHRTRLRRCPYIHIWISTWIVYQELYRAINWVLPMRVMLVTSPHSAGMLARCCVIVRIIIIRAGVSRLHLYANSCCERYPQLTSFNSKYKLEKFAVVAYALHKYQNLVMSRCCFAEM